MKTSELVKLVRDVFSVEPGASLLRELEQTVKQKDFDTDVNKQYWQAGQRYLIESLKSFIDMDGDQLAAIIKDEQTNEEEDL